MRFQNIQETIGHSALGYASIIWKYKEVNRASQVESMYVYTCMYIYITNLVLTGVRTHINNFDTS
jgi:hypothetical protein